MGNVKSSRRRNSNERESNSRKEERLSMTTTTKFEDQIAGMTVSVMCEDNKNKKNNNNDSSSEESGSMDDESPELLDKLEISMNDEHDIGGSIPPIELFNNDERILLSKLFKDLAKKSASLIDPNHQDCNHHPNNHNHHHSSTTNTTSNTSTTIGIDQTTFCRVFPLPGVLSQRLFELLDRKHIGMLSKDDFFFGVATVLKGSTEDQIRFVFRLFDLDNAGCVSRDDLETVVTCLVSSEQLRSLDLDEQRLVDEAMDKAENTTGLNLRQFAAWILANPFVWSPIHDAFALQSQWHATPAMRRRRSESASSLCGNPPTLTTPRSSCLSSNNMIIPNQTHLNDYPMKSPFNAHSMDAIQCSGYLSKIGRRLGFQVNRWFVLRGRLLYIFNKDTDTSPKHIILLHACEITSNHNHDSRLPYGIRLVTGIHSAKPKTLLVYAPDELSQAAWLFALRAAADAYHVGDFYEIKESLGHGKFSSVYRAIELETSEERAVKIIQRKTLSTKECSALLTEISVLRVLSHPNVIQIHDVFESAESISIVTAYIRGGDLFDRIVEAKRFPECVAKRVAFRLASVVRYLHRRGIVHRDLKPENIMCQSREDVSQIVVIDFGLSCFATPKSILSAPCGTLSYVAPEVLRGQGYSKAVDLWSVGVILYVMLRGRLPFDSKTGDKSQLIKRVLCGRFSMRNPIWENISHNAKNLIFRLLCTDPSRRITAQQMLNHAWFKGAVKPPTLRAVDEEHRPTPLAPLITHTIHRLSPLNHLHSPRASLSRHNSC